MTAVPAGDPAPTPAADPGSAARIELDQYDDIREALFNKDLSRTFDRRSFEEGNVRQGVVSTAHGDLHRARRRLENGQFRAEILRAQEEDLPALVGRLLDEQIVAGRSDLYHVGTRIAMVLTARRLGVDLDLADANRLARFDEQADGLAQMSELLDSRDPERTRRIARQALGDWGRDFVQPSLARRSGLLAAHGSPSSHLPNDLLTALLVHRADPALDLDDDGRIVRELATYLVGGMHTEAFALVNTVDLLLDAGAATSGVFARIVADRAFAQRCVHEAVRLRPNTPKPKRHVEADTILAGRPIPGGAIVVLDVARANRDPRIFGPTADRFEPDRDVPDGIARWGLSFGAGPHQCPGRTFAAGFPLEREAALAEGHLFGALTVMLQEVARRGVRRDPERPVLPDVRTERWTWWTSYPVTFEAVFTPEAALA